MRSSALVVTAVACALGAAIAGHEVGYRRGQRLAAASRQGPGEPAARPHGVDEAGDGGAAGSGRGADAGRAGGDPRDPRAGRLAGADPVAAAATVDVVQADPAGAGPGSGPHPAAGHEPDPDPSADARDTVDADLAAAEARRWEAATAEAGPGAAALLAFGDVRFDFGAVAHGTVAEHAFRYRNASTATVEIRDVRSSCGCTAAEPTRRTLAPGEEGLLTVRFDTARKPVAGLRQRLSSQVYVDAVAPALGARGRASTRLTIEGEALAHYATVPQAGLFFATAVEGQPTALARVEVLPSAAAAPPAGSPVPAGPAAPTASASTAAAAQVPALDPAVVRVTRLPPGLEVRAIRPVERDGRRGVALECVLGPGAPIGAYSDAIHLATGHALQPEVVVAVRAFVQPPVRAVPPRVTLGAGTTALPAIRVTGSRPIEVLTARIVPAGGGVAPFRAEARPGGQVALLPAEAPVDPQGGLAGEVWIVVAHPGHPLVRVPYHLTSGPLPAAAGPLRVASLTVTPGQAHLGDVDFGQRRATEVSVTDASAQPLALADLAVEPADVLEAEVRPSAAGPAGSPLGKLLVRTRAAAPAGPFTGSVSFRPRPGAERIVVPVTGRILAPVAADPEALWLAAGAEAEARALLRDRSGRPLEVRAVRASAGHLEARAEPAPGGAVVVAVRRSAGAPLPTAPLPTAPRADAVVEVDVAIGGAPPVTIRLPVVEAP